MVAVAERTGTRIGTDNPEVAVALPELPDYSGASSLAANHPGTAALDALQAAGGMPHPAALVAPAEHNPDGAEYVKAAYGWMETNMKNFNQHLQQLIATGHMTQEAADQIRGSLYEHNTHRPEWVVPALALQRPSVRRSLSGSQAPVDQTPEAGEQPSVLPEIPEMPDTQDEDEEIPGLRELTLEESRSLLATLQNKQQNLGEALPLHNSSLRRHIQDVHATLYREKEARATPLEKSAIDRIERSKKRYIERFQRHGKLGLRIMDVQRHIAELELGQLAVAQSKLFDTAINRLDYGASTFKQPAEAAQQTASNREAETAQQNTIRDRATAAAEYLATHAVSEETMNVIKAQAAQSGEDVPQVVYRLLVEPAQRTAKETATVESTFAPDTTALGIAQRRINPTTMSRLAKEGLTQNLDALIAAQADSFPRGFTEKLVGQNRDVHILLANASQENRERMWQAVKAESKRQFDQGILEPLDSIYHRLFIAGQQEATPDGGGTAAQPSQDGWEELDEPANIEPSTSSMFKDDFRRAPKLPLPHRKGLQIGQRLRNLSKRAGNIHIRKPGSKE